MLAKINEAVSFIKSKYDIRPSVGIVLGSGLGTFTREIKIEKEIAKGIKRYNYLLQKAEESYISYQAR